MGQLETRTLSSQARKRSNSLLPPAGWRAAGELGRAGRSVAANPATVTARPRVIGQAGRRSYRRRQRETPIGAAWQGKTQWRKSKGGIKFLFHVLHPPPQLFSIFRHRLYLNSLFRSSGSVHGCSTRAEILGCLCKPPSFPQEWRSPGRGRAGRRGYAAGGAAPGSVGRCQCVCPSLLHCLPPPLPRVPPPLPESPQPAASRVAATSSDR